MPMLRRAGCPHAPLCFNFTVLATSREACATAAQNWRLTEGQLRPLVRRLYREEGQTRIRMVHRVGVEPTLPSF